MRKKKKERKREHAFRRRHQRERESTRERPGVPLLLSSSLLMMLLFFASARKRQRVADVQRERRVRVIFCNEKKGRECTEISSQNLRHVNFDFFRETFAVTSRRPSSSIFSLSPLLTSSLFSIFFSSLSLSLLLCSLFVTTHKKHENESLL